MAAATVAAANARHRNHLSGGRTKLGARRSSAPTVNGMLLLETHWPLLVVAWLGICACCVLVAATYFHETPAGLLRPQVRRLCCFRSRAEMCLQPREQKAHTPKTLPLREHKRRAPPLRP